MSTPSTTKIDLLLLGLLLDRPMHGYELFQHIQAEGIDAWFNVSQAGVYYSLSKLRDLGWVSESRQRGARSAGRSTYGLTDEGRAAFFVAMEEQAAGLPPIYLDYDLVIYLLNRLPLQRATALLEQHLAALREETRALAASQAPESATGAAPLKLAVLDHRRRFLEMEHAWLEGVMRDVRGETPAAPRTGLMVLRGDLRHFHLPDLIRLVASGGHSGTLSVSDGAEVRSLGFHQGRPCCAAWRRSGEAAEPAPPPERVLAGVFDLFRWGEGQFTFDQTAGCPELGVAVGLSAEDLILAGCRWVDHWTLIQRLVPTSEAIFELALPPQRVEGLSLTEVERMVLAALDGARDVAAIAHGLGLTEFEASRALYCLAAAGVARSADLDKIRLRRVFRELAELMCASTVAWRTSPDDRTCEQEVNQVCAHLPVLLVRGRIEDRAEPRLGTDELVELYRAFLAAQLEVVSRRFGRDNARQSFQRTLRQLAPELQDVAHRHGFDKLSA